MQRLSKGLRYNLTLRYIVALSLVGLLILIGYSIGRDAIGEIQAHMQIIRAADTKAVAVERIQRTLLSAQVARDKKQMQSLIGEIQIQADRLTKAHENLSTSANEHNISDAMADLLQTIDQRYLSFINQYTQFSEHIEQYGSLDTANFKVLNTLEKLIDQSRELGVALQTLSEESERENLARMARYMTFDASVTILLLFLLAIEAFFVFRPAVSRMYAALAARSDFLGRISHEIRNPMNAIIGMSGILKNTDLSEQQKKYIANLDKASETLLSMLNNLLDFTALEKQKIKLEHTAFDLFEIVDRCVDLAATTAHSKDVEIRVLVAPDMPRHLIGDPSRIQQILINLLGNAVKFTNQGHVTLSMKASGDGAYSEDVPLQLIISDTGIGIDKEKLNQVFESFSQESHAIRNKYGGSGLGLSIVKDLVHLMGGEVSVESEKGVGTEFRVDLTLPRGEAQDEANPLNHFKAFYVSIDGASWRSESLSIYGAQIKNQLAAQAQGRQNARVVLDDSIGPKQMVDLAKVLVNANCKLLVLLKTTFPYETIEALKEIGVEDFIFKPFKAWLYSESSEVDGSQPVDDTPALSLPHTAEMASQPRVLVVDDSADNCLIVERMLQSLNWEALCFNDGEQAFIEFQKGRFDAVLLDLEMPGWSGTELARQIRQWEGGHTEPRTRIIAFSGHDSSHQQELLGKGFDAYLQKPFHKIQLVKILSHSPPHV